MALRNRIQDICLDKLFDYSRELAIKVKDSGYIPEHILFVERAGLIVGYKVAEYFNCDISGINSSRSGGSIKSRVKFILRYLPRFMTHFLRNIEIKSNIHDRKKGRHIFFEGQLPPKDKKILIVDDAIDTGHSVKAVLEYLKNEGYDLSKIKVAVLTTTGENPVLKADVSLLNQVVCAFPWSYDSREYHSTWRLYKKLRESVYLYG